MSDSRCVPETVYISEYAKMRVLLTSDNVLSLIRMLVALIVFSSQVVCCFECIYSAILCIKWDKFLKLSFFFQRK
jgi:hypothetical protein